MSRPHHSPISELVSRLIASIGDRQPKEVAAAIGVDVGYVRQWRRGRRPERMNPDTRDRIVAYLARTEGQGAVGHDPKQLGDVSVDVMRTPLGDAVLIAVGRFEAIDQMATELARIARQSGKRLAGAFATSVATPSEQAVAHGVEGLSVAARRKKEKQSRVRQKRTG